MNVNAEKKLINIHKKTVLYFILILISYLIYIIFKIESSSYLRAETRNKEDSFISYDFSFPKD